MIGAPRRNRQIPGGAPSAEIQRAYVGLQPANKWRGMGSNEGYTFFAH